MTEHIAKALASLAKAGPVLADHAQHIDGEFDNALRTIRTLVDQHDLTTHDGWIAEQNARTKQLAGVHGMTIEKAAVYASYTMPHPCPPKPKDVPSVTFGKWTVTHDGDEFVASWSNERRVRQKSAVYMATSICVEVWNIDALHAKLIALRDGPPPTYEVKRWLVTMSSGVEFVYFREEEARRGGGTVEPLYRRVEPTP